ncbi:MAG TPA: tRNA pseudouridine(55) synthase TruB [Polyangiaceae bacterium]|nr:tRNA pseudouridine(55) synthase TruB [Polyangiaceae bacterium]
MSGVLVVDKPLKLTSHDVVARARRALGTKRVGHAGTLDPMASGVLVLLAGEATKLAPFLTAHDKRYEATVTLGAATDTLDAAGSITAEADVPGELLEQIQRAIALAKERGQVADEDLAREAPLLYEALEAERARTEQTPPAYSAIKVAGQRSYDRARSGEAIDLEPRPVRVISLRLLPGDIDSGGAAHAARPALNLELEVSKGYYVRSFARDLGEHLGVPAHLSALRRTRSGPFNVEGALPLSAGPEALRAALVPVEQAAAESLPAARLTEIGAARARDGKPMSPADFTAPPPDTGELSAWIDPSGELVAVGLVEGSRLVIRRGFARKESVSEDP